MTQNTPDHEIDGLLKKQALAAFFGAFVFALIYFAAGLPYRVAVAGVSLFAAACYSACNMALTRRITRCAVENLRAGLEREGAEKEALLRKFSELNSTMQIGVLAHRISHDLRGPMAYISGYVELELAGEKTPDEKEQLNDLGETVASMGEILHGITRFGKTSGPSCEKIALGDLMRDLLAVAALFPQAKGVKFETLFSGDRNVLVSASRADLEQAYFNVIKNAAEAVSGNAGDKKIEIAVGAEGKEAKVSISDNGPGVPEDVREALFKKAVTTKKGGSGVGLLIARDLLIRNDGDIKLSDRAGGGLTVGTSLPAA